MACSGVSTRGRNDEREASAFWKWIEQGQHCTGNPWRVPRGAGSIASDSSSGHVDDGNGSRSEDTRAARRAASGAATETRQDECARRGAMPESRRQRRRHCRRGPIPQHRPRHVRRFQVADVVAQHLHRSRGRGRLFQPCSGRPITVSGNCARLSGRRRRGKPIFRHH